MGKAPELEDLIRAARGQVPVDLLIRDVNYVNLFTGEVYEASIGILGDRIAYITSDKSQDLKASEIFYGKG